MRRNISIDQLRSFVAVVEMGGFTPAAHRLNRTQSATSMHVRKLEDLTGTSFFTRTRGDLQLTPAGEYMLAHARRMLQLNDKILADLETTAVSGSVRFGLTEAYVERMLPNVLDDFYRTYPNVRVAVEAMPSPEVRRALGQALDVGIEVAPPGESAGERLFQEKLTWLAGARISLNASESLPLALFPDGCLFRRWALRALDRAGRPWHLAFVSSSRAAVMSMVRTGRAVTVAQAGSRLDGLVPCAGALELPELPSVEVSLLASETAQRPAVRCFQDHLRAAFVA